MLTESEKRQILYEWNATETAGPWDRCVHELFEQQAERTPDNTALAFEQTRLSYRELNARANQLAHYLIARGVGPEVRAGLDFERSAEAVIAILGVLKAGGAYVPLDPQYPEDRLAMLRADADVHV